MQMVAYSIVYVLMTFKKNLWLSDEISIAMDLSTIPIFILFDVKMFRHKKNHISVSLSNGTYGNLYILGWLNYATKHLFRCLLTDPFIQHCQ